MNQKGRGNTPMVPVHRLPSLGERERTTGSVSRSKGHTSPPPSAAVFPHPGTTATEPSAGTTLLTTADHSGDTGLEQKGRERPDLAQEGCDDR